MHRYLFPSCLPALVLSLAVAAAPRAPAADNNDKTAATTAPKKEDPQNQKPGDFLKVPEDGTPWQHNGTSLRFPQILGKFALAGVFRDNRPDAGVAVTYVRPDSDVKASVVMFPCPEKLELGKDVLGITRREHEKIISDLQAIAQRGGYAEKQRSPLSEQSLDLWRSGKIPMTVQTVELAPTNAPPPGATAPDSLSHWLALLLYKDHFVQISVVVPGKEMQKDRKQVDDLITQLLQCIREPALRPELLALCQLYQNEPLTDAGRHAADSILKMAKESPVLEVILPGEALTAMLNQVGSFSPEGSLDLLRAFVVGSSVVAIQGGPANDSLEHGALILTRIAAHLKENDSRYALPFIEELTKAVDEKRAASFLKEKMQTAKKP